jgi:protein-ribulosamine 3-kinase
VNTFSSATWRDAAVAALGRSGSPKWSIATQGPWTTAWSLHVGREHFFVKTAPIANASMLEAEADGLRALASSGAHSRNAPLRAPAVHVRGAQGETAFLVLSWLDLGDARRGDALARALACLHRVAAPTGPRGERYGWQRDNYIGATPQRNGWEDDWAIFYRDHRIGPQVERALKGGHRGVLRRDSQRLLEAVPLLLAGHAPVPTLLHGDLWSGNAGTLMTGAPVVFDPAVYVGDRETDLAMTRLFGGFESAFYRAYEEIYPLPSGHEERRELYNLYHVLNHLNLFGSSYLARAEEVVGRLLARV